MEKAAMVGQVDATQLLGLVSFAVAATASILVAVSQRRLRTIPMLAAIVYVLAGMELFVNLRFQAAGALQTLVGLDHAHRTTWQLPALALIVVAVPPLLWLGLRRAASRFRAMLLVASVTVALFALETVSLHAVDAMLYRSVAGILVIGWLWMLIGAAAALAAMVADRPA